MNFEYELILPKDNHWQMSKWCTQQFGPRWEAIGYRQGTWCTFWEGRDNFGMYRWHFKNEKDMVWFKLRWL